MLTGREDPFEADIDWLQLSCTAVRVRAYVEPTYTVLVQSVVAEGDELFPALMAHLRRPYPEVYGLAVDTDQEPERRELLLG